MEKFKISLLLLSFGFLLIVFSNTNAQSFMPIYQKGSGKLVTDLTIGGDTEDENYLLNSPSQVVVDSRGNILVLDSGEDHIKKFDSNGKYLITIGKRGRGPG